MSPSWALSPTHTAVKRLIRLLLIFQSHIRSGSLVMWSQETTLELIGTLSKKTCSNWVKYYHSRGFIGARGRLSVFTSKRKQSWRIGWKTAKRRNQTQQRDSTPQVNMILIYLQNLRWDVDWRCCKNNLASRGFVKISSMDSVGWYCIWMISSPNSKPS